ncbi:MAG: diguanylate cyclase (GGDEF)-like protein [Pseudohongiellaceae bacterium]|jgi:diguanylate cyclase (GGDEF)-like protein
MENLALTAALALVSMVAAAGLFINWAGNKKVPGLLLIAAAFSVTSTGILLLATQGIWPAIVSVFLANCLVLLGAVPLLIGLAKFWNQESSTLVITIVALCLLTIAGIYYFTLVSDEAIWRIRVFTVMIVIFNISYVYVISKGLQQARKRRPIMSMNPNFGAFTAIALSSFTAVAGLVMMFLRADAPLDSTDIGTSIFLLGAIFFAAVFPFTVIIMTVEETNLEHQENAIFDSITTILNHRTFLEVGERVMGIALRYSKPVSLLTIEIDDMDKVVKKFGTNIANEMLRHFSLIANDRRRSEDVLARTSFKEFGMLLPGVDQKGCEVVIRRINKTLQEESFSFSGEQVPISVTIAAVTRQEEGLNLTDMLQEGQIELHRRKLATV